MADYPQNSSGIKLAALGHSVAPGSPLKNLLNTKELEQSVMSRSSYSQNRCQYDQTVLKDTDITFPGEEHFSPPTG
jgi:hypothetical protein